MLFTYDGALKEKIIYGSAAMCGYLAEIMVDAGISKKLAKIIIFDAIEYTLNKSEESTGDKDD